MRTAICLSGLTRNYQRSLVSIEKYFPDAHIFAHTYKIADINQITNDSWSKDLTKSYYENETLSPLEIIGKYSPISAEITDYKAIKPFFSFLYSISGVKEQENLSVISMFYSIQAANDLKIRQENKEGREYDLVVRMRYDALLNDFNLLSYNCKMLNIPASQDVMLTNPSNGINDQFAFGPSQEMNYYSNVFDLISQYGTHFNRFYPEQILSKHLEDRKIARPFINMRICKSRNWLKQDLIYEKVDDDLPSLAEAKTILMDTELFHEHDSIFLHEDETDPTSLEVSLISGSQYWPHIPPCCEPYCKGSLRIKTGTQEWKSLEQYGTTERFIKFLKAYCVVLATESGVVLK